MWETAKALLGETPTESEDDARKISTLPMQMGGLGLRSAEQCRPVAFWASWADALPMIAKRNPEVASEAVQKLSQEEPFEGASLSSTQLPAFSILDSRFRKCPCLLAVVPLVRPHLKSHSGHNSSCALSHAPTMPEFAIAPHLFQVLLHERLRLPSFLTESTCQSA